jgi:hypothetical protein
MLCTNQSCCGICKTTLLSGSGGLAMADIFWHALETEEVLIRLAVDPKRGLSREEA